MVLFTFSENDAYVDFDDRPDVERLEWLSKAVRDAYNS
jgi:hypothetical protein